jgi:hypothetical protein
MMLFVFSPPPVLVRSSLGVHKYWWCHHFVCTHSGDVITHCVLCNSP